MAFTARTPTVTNLASIAASPYNFTVNVPGSTAIGDIMFCHICTVIVTIDSVPAGWELVASRTVATSYRFYLYWKLASGSEPANYTWSLSASGKVRAAMIAYTAGDFEVSLLSHMVISNTEYVTNNTTLRAAPITVPWLNSPLVFFGGSYQVSEETFTKPATLFTWTEDLDSGSTDPDFWTTICSGIWTGGSGSTGNVDATISGIDTQKHAFMVALAPKINNKIIAVCEL